MGPARAYWVELVLYHRDTYSSPNSEAAIEAALRALEGRTVADLELDKAAYVELVGEEVDGDDGAAPPGAAPHGHEPDVR